jgi:hypothetical protein
MAESTRAGRAAPGPVRVSARRIVQEALTNLLLLIMV